MTRSNTTVNLVLHLLQVHNKFERLIDEPSLLSLQPESNGSTQQSKRSKVGSSNFSSTSFSFSTSAPLSDRIADSSSAQSQDRSTERRAHFNALIAENQGKFVGSGDSFSLRPLFFRIHQLIMTGGEASSTSGPPGSPPTGGNGSPEIMARLRD
jgi:hypothetical protein